MKLELDHKSGGFKEVDDYEFIFDYLTKEDYCELLNSEKLS